MHLLVPVNEFGQPLFPKKQNIFRSRLCLITRDIRQSRTKPLATLTQCKQNYIK